LLVASALQIFKLESHPSGFKAETGREGFSLYGTNIVCAVLSITTAPFFSFRFLYCTYSYFLLPVVMNIGQYVAASAV